LVGDSYQIAEYNKEHPNAPLRILNQRLLGFYETFFADQQFLLPMLEKVIPLFKESGIINHIMSNLDQLPLELIDPQVMTLNHLAISFKVHFILIALSFFVFAVEVCVHSIKRLCILK